ncbi:unnamed protein product [Lupinus luteus]|uniref:NAB domain-containing protein n=1 Tax=Lupinus luteus TaxID=3873 RepID=A0AAV1YDE4_LUPLU
MDGKVKTMIELIEEDADSFARRAEMYYKKRPELIELVKDFYRAYRALAERYDHATVELRHAHKTMAKAFPSHTHHYMPFDDSPCDTSESHIQGMPHPICESLEPAFQFSPINAEEFEDGGSGKGLKQKLKRQSYSEYEHAGRAESEVQTLRKALAKMQSDKDDIFLQYQKSSEKLSKMESDLIKPHKDEGGLDEQASNSEIKIKILNDEFARMEAEKDVGLLQYNKSLEKIAVLEAKITLSEENSRMLNEQIERAEVEVKALRVSLAQLSEEKGTVAVHYHQCLEKISIMDSEILRAQEDSKRLNREVEKGAEKLKNAEKQCDMLEESNQSLQLEAENLVQKIAMKDRELLEKHAEIERLETQKHEQHSYFLQTESTLQNLQNLYSQSQQDQRTLALELKYGLHLLKDLELSKQGFKEEMQEIVEENMTLHELNISSTRSLKRLQMKISKLKAIKGILERESALNAEESNALQSETHQIKDDIQDLNHKYQAMLEQLKTLGLNPNCFAAYVKDLQNENTKLKEVCKMERNEKESLREKLKDIDQILVEIPFMEFSLHNLNDELDGLKATVMTFKESCQVLQEEKSIVVDEKSTLLSQLQITTEIMPRLLEKNTLLEKSLSDAENELESLKDKSRSFEETCKLLNDEKCIILNERSILVSQLESVEARLGDLEKRFRKLEENYSDAEKGKYNTDNKVEELHAATLVQEEHVNHKHSTEARLTNLENLVNALQEEQWFGKTEFEEEFDKAVNAQLERFILQSFVEDLEQRNLALLIECEEHAEASEFSDKVISELEGENLMQQLEREKLESEKRVLVQEFENTREKNENLQNDKVKLMEINMQLRSSVTNGEEKENILKSELSAVHVELIYLRTTNQVFQEEKSKLLEEKKSLLKSVLDLKDALSTAEDGHNAILHEVLALSNLNLVYEGIITEKVVEHGSLSEHLSNFSLINSDLKQELFVLNNKLEMKETQNSRLTHQIENSENLVMKKDAELFEMEKWQKTAEFCRSNEKLKMEDQESQLVREKLEKRFSELSENCANHKNEIEQHRVREEALNTQLLERTNEVDIWEAEATAFYSDLHILSISEALLQSKVNELTGVCKRLDDESAEKSMVIEEMTERVKLLESEIEAYIPIITSWKEEFASLENTFLLWTNKSCVVGNGEQKDMITENRIEEKGEHKSKLIPDVISYLLSIQVRIRAVKNVMMQKIKGSVKDENRSAIVETGTLTEVAEDSNLEVTTYDIRKEVMELMELDACRKSSENWLLKKAIPADHNSDDPESKYCKRDHTETDDLIPELCENAHSGSARTELNNSERWKILSSESEIEKELGVDKLELWKVKTKTGEDGKERILDRIASDGQKLGILDVTVEDLKKKKPMNKKRRQGNESNDTEHETFMKQIESVAEAMKQLAYINDQLMKDIEGITPVPPSSMVEQARQGSEQIGRLQFEVQKIQHILLKLADEKNNKGKNRLWRPTSLLLRDSIHIEKKKNSIRPAKNCLYGCSRPSTNEE